MDNLLHHLQKEVQKNIYGRKQLQSNYVAVLLVYLEKRNRNHMQSTYTPKIKKIKMEKINYM